MKHPAALPHLVLVLLALASSGLPAMAADLSAVVPPGAAVVKLAGGFQFTEGPAWGPGGYLAFSDIPANRVLRLAPDNTTRDILSASEGANGLVFEGNGALFVCQGGARRVIRVDLDQGNKITVLADSHDGKKLNSPNDLALDGHGGLYFTDPRYGAGSGPVEQPVQGVYYIDAALKVTRVIDDLPRPNGILVTPDGKRLLVANIDRRELVGYDIVGPGKLAGRKLLFTGDQALDGGGPDGMALDREGNIYATYKGIVVLDPAGSLLGRIPVPEQPANCTFGGKDLKTLYITARTGLYAIDLKIPGAPLFAQGPGGVTASAPAPQAAAGATREVKAGALILKAPTAWKDVGGDGRMRAGQLEVPAALGDKEPSDLIIYYFGKGGAGGVAANIQRWIGQFEPEGRKVKLTQGKDQGGVYVLAEVTGTYKKPVGPPIAQQSKPLPGARMLAAIVERADGPYFLKLAGPEKTVTAAAEAFRASFGGDARAETEYKLP